MTLLAFTLQFESRGGSFASNLEQVACSDQLILLPSPSAQSEMSSSLQTTGWRPGVSAGCTAGPTVC